MNLTESSPTEKKTKARWWTVGYQLSGILAWILFAISFSGFPGNRSTDAVRSSALSESDLIEAEMAIQDELAENSTATPVVSETEGWKMLERAVDAQQEHFFAIDEKRRRWDRFFLWGLLAAFVGMIFFGKFQAREVDRQWDENLPKGRRHQWGKRPNRGLKSHGADKCIEPDSDHPKGL